MNIIALDIKYEIKTHILNKEHINKKVIIKKNCKTTDILSKKNTKYLWLSNISGSQLT